VLSRRSLTFVYVSLLYPRISYSAQGGSRLGAVSRVVGGIYAVVSRDQLPSLENGFIFQNAKWGWSRNEQRGGTETTRSDLLRRPNRCLGGNYSIFFQQPASLYPDETGRKGSCQDIRLSQRVHTPSRSRAGKLLRCGGLSTPIMCTDIDISLCTIFLEVQEPSSLRRQLFEHRSEV